VAGAWPATEPQIAGPQQIRFAYWSCHGKVDRGRSALADRLGPLCRGMPERVLSAMTGLWGCCSIADTESAVLLQTGRPRRVRHLQLHFGCFAAFPATRAWRSLGTSRVGIAKEPIQLAGWSTSASVIRVYCASRGGGHPSGIPIAPANEVRTPQLFTSRQFTCLYDHQIIS
jgi:hypothetical protein